MDNLQGDPDGKKNLLHKRNIEIHDFIDLNLI